MSRSSIQRISIVSVILLCQSAFLIEAFAQEAAADPHQKDRDAIASFMQSFVKSFESRDAKQLAAHWTTEGEFENAFGVVVQGQSALEGAFAESFAKTPEASAKLQQESLRFLSKDSAIQEGTVSIRRGPTQPSTEANYSASLIREDGKWLLTQMTESPFDEVSMENLEWLIGEWKGSSGQEAELLISYAWEPNKKFIRVKLSRTEKDLVITGTQVIGINPATGQLHSWIFEADGGIVEAVWSRDGDSWVLSASGTLADGQTILETNVFRRIDDDTITYQSIGRVVDDVQRADLPPMRVTRVKQQ